MTTYHELLAQKDALEEKIKEALRVESEEAIDGIRRLVAAYGLTAKECGFSQYAEPKATVTQINQVKIRVPAAIKYRGPNGETWTGRGRAPGWLDAIVRNGGSRDDYLVAEKVAA